MGIEQVYNKGGLDTECMCVFDGMCQNVPNEVDIYTLLLTTSTNKRECPYTIIPQIYMATHHPHLVMPLSIYVLTS